MHASYILDVRSDSDLESYGFFAEPRIEAGLLSIAVRKPGQVEAAEYLADYVVSALLSRSDGIVPRFNLFWLHANTDRARLDQDLRHISERLAEYALPLANLFVLHCQDQLDWGDVPNPRQIIHLWVPPSRDGLDNLRILSLCDVLSEDTQRSKHGGIHERVWQVDIELDKLRTARFLDFATAALSCRADKLRQARLEASIPTSAIDLPDANLHVNLFDEPPRFSLLAPKNRSRLKREYDRWSDIERDELTTQGHALTKAFLESSAELARRPRFSPADEDPSAMGVTELKVAVDSRERDLSQHLTQLLDVCGPGKHAFPDERTIAEAVNEGHTHHDRWIRGLPRLPIAIMTVGFAMLVTIGPHIYRSVQTSEVDASIFWLTGAVTIAFCWTFFRMRLDRSRLKEHLLRRMQPLWSGLSQYKDRAERRLAFFRTATERRAAARAARRTLSALQAREERTTVRIDETRVQLARSQALRTHLNETDRVVVETFAPSVEEIWDDHWIGHALVFVKDHAVNLNAHMWGEERQAACGEKLGLLAGSLVMKATGKHE